MAGLWSWRAYGAAIAGAMMLLASPARAGCNPNDIVDAVKQGVSAVSACETACKNQVSCGLSLWLLAALTGMATQGGQAEVNSFCSQAQGTADQIASTAETVFGNEWVQKNLVDLSDKLSSVTAPAMIVRCACDSQQAGLAVQNSIGVCLTDVLCALDELIFGNRCECTPQPPQIANCSAYDPAKCQSTDYIHQLSDPTCYPAGNIVNCNTKWQSCASYKDYSPSLERVDTPDGTLVLVLPPSINQCEAVRSCFCPKPMTLGWHEMANPDRPGRKYVFSCDCPEKTHPGATMPNGISTCLCDNTGEPAIMSGLAIQGMCPPAACPAGQVRLGQEGECVTPCSDPTQGMAFDGSCCNPAQMSSCGECCPPDTVPDATKGTCVPRPKPPK